MSRIADLRQRLKDMPSSVWVTATYAMTLVLSKSVSLIMLPFVTRFLTPAEYGVLEVLATYADVASLVLGLGLVETLHRFAAKNRDDRYPVAATLSGVTIAIGIVGLILGQLSVPMLAWLLPGEATELQIRIITYTLVLTAGIQVPLAWLQMNDHATRYMIVVLFRVIAQAGLIVVFLLQGWGVDGVLIAGAISDSCVTVVLLILQYRSTGLSIKWRKLKPLLAYATPLVFGGIALFIMGSFDRLLLADAVGTTKVAHYAIAVKFSMVASLILKPYEMWWYPRRFSVLNGPNGKQQTADQCTFAICLVLIVCAGIALGAPAAIRVLTPEGYHASTAYVALLCGLAALRSISMLINVGCYMKDTGTTPMVIDIVSAVLALTGYLLLIPILEVYGAILATYIAYLLRTILFYVVSQRHIFLDYPWLRLFSMIALSIFAVYAAYQTGSSVMILAGSVVVPGIITIGAYSLGLLRPLSRQTA